MTRPLFSSSLLLSSIFSLSCLEAHLGKADGGSQHTDEEEDQERPGKPDGHNPGDHPHLAEHGQQRVHHHHQQRAPKVFFGYSLTNKIKKNVAQIRKNLRKKGEGANFQTWAVADDRALEPQGGDGQQHAAYLVVNVLEINVQLFQQRRLACRGMKKK